MSTSTKMNIPETISVGYQKREDTYTGKLAYVVYTDAKGKLRKELSWNGWRDNKIDPETFKNEPMSGFVLNKGVGGSRYSSGWNARNEYIRVYDPRGFEFEISVANLLFILQECTSTKGKGLEGEFVYSWDRADLVLLPTGSAEYTECVKFTQHQTTKVTKNDMVEGCTYMMKDMVEVMYLGRQEWYEPDYEYDYNHNKGNKRKHYLSHKGKKHIFLCLNPSEKTRSYKDNHDYIIQTGFTKLAAKTSEEPISLYAGAYDKFKGSVFNSPVTEVKVTKKTITKKDLNREVWWNKTFLVKEKDKWHVTMIYLITRDNDYIKEKKGTYNMVTTNSVFSPSLRNGKCTVPEESYHGKDTHRKNITQEQLLNKELYTAALSTGRGQVHNILKG